MDSKLSAGVLCFVGLLSLMQENGEAAHNVIVVPPKPINWSQMKDSNLKIHELGLPPGISSLGEIVSEKVLKEITGQGWDEVFEIIRGTCENMTPFAKRKCVWKELGKLKINLDVQYSRVHFKPSPYTWDRMSMAYLFETCDVFNRARGPDTSPHCPSPCWSDPCDSNSRCRDQGQFAGQYTCEPKYRPRPRSHQPPTTPRIVTTTTTPAPTVPAPQHPDRPVSWSAMKDPNLKIHQYGLPPGITSFSGVFPEDGLREITGHGWDDVFDKVREKCKDAATRYARRKCNWDQLVNLKMNLDLKYSMKHSRTSPYTLDVMTVAYLFETCDVFNKALGPDTSPHCPSPCAGMPCGLNSRCKDKGQFAGNFECTPIVSYRATAQAATTSTTSPPPTLPTSRSSPQEVKDQIPPPPTAIYVKPYVPQASSRRDLGPPRRKNGRKRKRFRPQRHRKVAAGPAPTQASSRPAVYWITKSPRREF